MDSYKIEISRSAVEAIQKLPVDAQKKVVKAIEKLTEPRKSPGVEKLSGHPGFFRIKAGQYRVIFAKKTEESLIVVLIVRHRKDAYSGLEFLDQKLAHAISELTAIRFAPESIADPSKLI